jgi:ribonuclease HI
MKYIIYTDGACSKNPGQGGWGAVIIDEDEKQYNVSGKVKDTTNNRMELMAPIMALKKIKTKSDVTIFTDSIYVKRGITEWIKNWEKNGWKSANKKSVKNKDLWVKLNDLCQKNNVKWEWVKGHSNNKFNNLADKLATEAINN